MSKSVPSNKQIMPSGIVFGDAEALHGERLVPFLFNENSQAACILIHTFHSEILLRFKPSQLVQLRDRLTEVIDFMAKRPNKT